MLLLVACLAWHICIQYFLFLLWKRCMWLCKSCDFFLIIYFYNILYYKAMKNWRRTDNPFLHEYIGITHHQTNTQKRTSPASKHHTHTLETRKERETNLLTFLDWYWYDERIRLIWIYKTKMLILSHHRQYTTLWCRHHFHQQRLSSSRVCVCAWVLNGFLMFHLQLQLLFFSLRDK